MNHDLHEIHVWLIANKLSLNVIKTKYDCSHEFNTHVDSANPLVGMRLTNVGVDG